MKPTFGISMIYCAWAIAGCASVANLPTVSPDGCITGGEPRLARLMEEINKGRGREETVQSQHFAICVLPVRHLVHEAGELPAIAHKAKATYDLFASIDSATTAEIGLVTCVKSAPDGALQQESRVFRWEGGAWVLTDLGNLQVMPRGQ